MRPTRNSVASKTQTCIWSRLVIESKDCLYRPKLKQSFLSRDLRSVSLKFSQNISLSPPGILTCAKTGLAKCCKKTESNLSLITTKARASFCASKESSNSSLERSSRRRSLNTCRFSRKVSSISRQKLFKNHRLDLLQGESISKTRNCLNKNT